MRVFSRGALIFLDGGGTQLLLLGFFAAGGRAGGRAVLYVRWGVWLAGWLAGRVGFLNGSL